MNDLNTIKKYLYKNKRLAEFIKIQSGILYYWTSMGAGKPILYHIPISEIGDTPFLGNMEAQLLIRWIKLSEDERTT